MINMYKINCYACKQYNRAIIFSKVNENTVFVVTVYEGLVIKNCAVINTVVV